MVCLHLNVTQDPNDVADMSTPTDIAYSTPHDSQTTLRSTLSPDPPMIQAAAWTSSPSKLPTVHYLRLVWNGHTRSDIENIYREAQLLERTGKPEDAELKLREALTGLENLLTPTHDETNKVGYHLADFYARNNRMKDADIVLSRMIDAHMGQWGIEHKKTITHLVHIADLFQSWSRTDDAITLLSRAAEAHQKLLKHAVPSSSESGQTVEQFSYPQHSTEGSTHFASRPTHAPTFNSQEHDRNQVEYQISVAKAQMAAKDTGDDNIEDLLLGLVEQCEKHPEGLAIQIFDARQALVELYQKSDNSGKVSKTLIDAENAFWAIMKSGAKKTAVLLQAAIDITALHVRHKRYEPANLMFEEIQAKMVEIFGIDDHVTISLLISIGIVYQRQKRWSDAQPRFEQALAASMTANSLESNITRGLEEALEEQCYLMSNPQSQGLTSTTAKRGSHCLGHEFGCHDTRSVLNSFVSSENGR
jgi:tetratricopeptide (TPR) repeat protein